MLKMVAAVTLLSAALPAVATAQTTGRQIHVSYHDLDLRRASDVQQLDQRLKTAIETACSGDDSADWQRKLANKRCHAARQHEVQAPRSLALAKAARGDLVVASTQ